MFEILLEYPGETLPIANTIREMLPVRYGTKKPQSWTYYNWRIKSLTEHAVKRLRTFYNYKHKIYSCMQCTPGSWPARTARNPVVPTTVNKNAACTIKYHIWNPQSTFESYYVSSNFCKTLEMFYNLWVAYTNLTSFLTLGMARFSAFFIPRVVSSRKEVCTKTSNSTFLKTIHMAHLIVS